jgi:hypothetical protein
LTDSNREFSVHGRHVDRHHVRLLSEPSFEAAAVAYVEDLALVDGPEVSVIVRDLATGHERCFRIDLETGEAAVCA